jgi:hypothetical protein
MVNALNSLVNQLQPMLRFQFLVFSLINRGLSFVQSLVPSPKTPNKEDCSSPAPPGRIPPVCRFLPIHLRHELEDVDEVYKCMHSNLKSDIRQ